MADAIEYAHNNGVVLVASSGNDGFTDFLCYPASDDLVIAVGASDMRGDITNYSNYGVGIDLTAPGGDTSADLDGDGYGDGILQETMKKGTWGYFFYQGTSMASPHVAGAAALLISKGLVEPEEIRQALELSADDMGDVGPDEEYGYGLLNVDAAIKFEAPEEEAPDISDVQIVRNGGHRVTITWRTSEPGTTKGMSNEQWKYTDNDMVTSHQITLKPSQFRGVNFSDGEMQRLKIVSHTADGREMRDDIDFGGFDDPQDDLFAATRGSADSCDGIASECQGRLALAIEVSDTFVAACQDWIADCRCAGTVQEHVQIRCDERSDIRLDRAELAYDECMIVAEECRGNGLAQEL
jgi:hypothetical protein